MASHFQIAAAVIASVCGCGSQPAIIEEPVDRDTLSATVQLELDRVAEVFALVDRFSQSAWQGFYAVPEEGIAINFPDGTKLALGETVLDGGTSYHPIRDTTIAGRPCFVHLPPVPGDRNAILIFANGHEDGPSHRIDVRLQELPSQIVVDLMQARSSPFPQWMVPFADCSTEESIRQYAHELFHAYQDSVWRERLGGHSLRDTHISITADHAAFTEVEGRALSAALGTSDKEPTPEETLVAVADFLAARTAKQVTMAEWEISRELEITKLEGIAEYVSEALLFNAAVGGYSGTIDLSADPTFFQYQVASQPYASLPAYLVVASAYTRDDEFKYYLFGAAQARLLDRFMPEWKTSFAWNASDIGGLLSAIPGMEALVAQEAGLLEQKYDLPALRQRHAAVLAEETKP
jgi:hypothetical protein